MLTDEQLVEQLQKGKTRALDELYRRYARPLYAFCANITHSKDPEDVVHDVFMRVIEAVERFNPQKASFRTWLFRIARNRCIDIVRREKNVKIISLEKKTQPNNPGTGATLKDTLADDRENVEQALTRVSEIEAVRECISELRHEEEREAIVLYYITGKVYREIGEMLGKSTSMAKNYVNSAQEKVKRCLERKGF
jgi:RNA polymerase sigma-70 factor (ECF subfamily)